MSLHPHFPTSLYVPLILGKVRPKDRSEQDITGYRRAGEVKAPRGAKAGLVLAAIRQQSGEFRLTDIEQACPGMGREWIRSLLSDLKAAGDATCQGKGPAARWRYLGSKGSNS